MRNSLILLLVNMLLVSSIMGQTATTSISGKITNTAGREMADVSIFVSKKGQKYSILASCLSEQDGSFSVTFKSSADSVIIHATGLNIANKKIICANQSQHLNISVEEKEIEIKELVVRAPKISSRGDTINYNVASFQSKNDISIGQVLQRLPGIEVRATGQILYQGLPIKNFFIEGMDLLKDRYGIATNNIDPNSISVVQVLERHQDIKALKDLKPEERASINLKLKAGVRGVFNLIATIGGGYQDEALWNNELIATYFQRNRQLLATYKGNNSGNELETELLSFSNDGLSKTYEVSEIIMPSAPEISKRYYYFNKSHSATYNHIFRVGQDGELGINVLFLNDKDERSNESISTTMLPDGSKNIVDEKFNGILRKNMANGTITYKHNSDRKYILEQMILDMSATKGESYIFTNEDIEQNSKMENYRLFNHLHFIHRTDGGRGMEFSSRINLEKKPHRLFVIPNLFPDVLAGNSMLQTAERSNISTENKMNFLSKLICGAVHIAPTIVFDYSHDGLTGILESYDNDISLSEINTGIGLYADCKLKKFRFTLEIPVNYRYFGLKNNNTYVATNRHKVQIEPSLSLSYDINGKNSLQFDGSLGYTSPAIENLYDKYILTSYRQLSVYENNDLYQSKMQSYSLSYNYKDIVSMLFFGADVGWMHNRPDVLYGSYYDGVVERIISCHARETADVLSAKLRFSQGFDWKQLIIGAECHYSYYDNPILLQNEIVRYHGSALTGNMNLHFNPFSWLGFVYKGTYYQSHTHMQNGNSMPALRMCNNNISFDFFLPYDITIGTSATYYYNNLNHKNPSFMLGEANIKYTYKICSFSLSCSNIFNKETYVYSSSSGLTEHISTYNIRPRSFILKVRVRIL